MTEYVDFALSDLVLLKGKRVRQFIELLSLNFLTDTFLAERVNARHTRCTNIIAKINKQTKNLFS